MSDKQNVPVKMWAVRPQNGLFFTVGCTEYLAWQEAAGCRGIPKKILKQSGYTCEPVWISKQKPAQPNHDKLGKQLVALATDPLAMADPENWGRIEVIGRLLDNTPVQQSEATITEAVVLAQFFHDTYEQLAPRFGYETRDDTKSFDADSPNGKLMIAVCGVVLERHPPSTELLALLRVTIEELVQIREMVFSITLLSMQDVAPRSTSNDAVDMVDSLLARLRARLAAGNTEKESNDER